VDELRLGLVDGGAGWLVEMLLVATTIVVVVAVIMVIIILWPREYCFNRPRVEEESA